MAKDSDGVMDQGRMPSFSWNPADRCTSLDGICKFVRDEACKAKDWYPGKKRSKKMGAIVLRVAAIILVVAAAVFPMVLEIFNEFIPAPWDSPLWASLALALAGGLILLDRFFGFSSAWIRYMKAELELDRAIEEFEIDWQVMKAKCGDPSPSDDEVEEFLDKVKEFIGIVKGIVQKETSAWATEFSQVLRQIEQTTSPPKPLKSGG